MIYVYAIFEPPGESFPLPYVRGLEDRPAELRTIDRLGAAFTFHEPAAIPRTPENALAHERVVESLMGDFTLLPARFGTMFTDIATLDVVLRSSADRLTAGLDHVRGSVELGLRVLFRENPAQQDDPPLIDVTSDPTRPPPAVSGRAYMLARLARERRSREAHHAAEQLAGELHDELAALARDSTRRVIPEPVPQLSASYLVPRTEADTFNARVRQLAAEHSNLRVLCTGPWPPYHFVPTLLTPEAAHA